MNNQLFLTIHTHNSFYDLDRLSHVDFLIYVNFYEKYLEEQQKNNK